MTKWRHDNETSLPVYRPYGASISGGSSTHMGQLHGKPTLNKPVSQMHVRLTTLVQALAVLCLVATFMMFVSTMDGAVKKRAGAATAPRIATLTRSANGSPVDATTTAGEGTAAAAAAAQIKSATQPSFPAADLQNLVLVAGHAVYTGVDYHLAANESSWFLEDYQKVPGEAQSFLDHIALGIEAASKDPRALLLFSGGQTRKAAGPRSEGLSYWVVAEAADWFGHKEVRSRAYTEEHARDSFENVLFSLCRFYEITGHYPTNITAVSYSLKQRRFEGLHRSAVKFPRERFSFIGTPIPPAAKGAQAGEAATVAAFAKDPYGCSGTLRAKKERRDPFAVGPIHPSRCPGMAPLLAYCGRDTFTGAVPWTAQPKPEVKEALQELGGRASEADMMH